MNRVICKTGETFAGTATVTLHRGANTVVIKEVSADICDNWRACYLSAKMTDGVPAIAEAAASKSVEVEVLRWAASQRMGVDWLRLGESGGCPRFSL